jgi:hypothetical protein
MYAAFLALVTVTARRAYASVASYHLSSLLLGTLSVYAYRDIWPLLTFTLSPVDAREGALLWARIGLLAFAAVLIPLLVPRQYKPIDPKAKFTLTKSHSLIADAKFRIPSRPSTLNRLPHFYLWCYGHSLILLFSWHTVFHIYHMTCYHHSQTMTIPGIS